MSLFTTLIKCSKLNKCAVSLKMFAVIEKGVVLNTCVTEPSCIHRRQNSIVVTVPQRDIIVDEYSAAPVRLVTTCQSYQTSARQDGTTASNPVESPSNIHCLSLERNTASSRPPPTASTHFSAQTGQSQANLDHDWSNRRFFFGIFLALGVTSVLSPQGRRVAETFCSWCVSQTAIWWILYATAAFCKLLHSRSKYSRP